MGQSCPNLAYLYGILGIDPVSALCKAIIPLTVLSLWPPSVFSSSFHDKFSEPQKDESEKKKSEKRRRMYIDTMCQKRASLFFNTGYVEREKTNKIQTKQTKTPSPLNL